MNQNDAFQMGGHTARQLGFDLAHQIGNQMAAMECAQREEQAYLERLYRYVTQRIDSGLPVSEKDLDTLRKAGYAVR